MGTTIEGVVANVDTTCGGKAAADCLAIVEVKASPTSSQGGSSTPSSAPSGSSTTSSGYSTSNPSTSGSSSQTMKIMIPKSLKITSEASGASATTPVKLAKGDKVKITYEKKQDVNVATAVTVTKSGS